MHAPEPSIKPFTRVMAFAVVATALLVLIVCMVGIIGVWAANTPATQAALNTVRPLISTLKAAEGAMDEVNRGLGSANDFVGGLKELLDSAGLIKDLLPGVAEGVGNLSGSLANLQTTLTDSGSKLVTARGLLEMIEGSITRWIDLLSVLLTIFLMWIAFSQASLFIHGWLYATGSDLLGKRKLNEGNLPQIPNKTNQSTPIDSYAGEKEEKEL
jgi:hypothetical protein